MAAFSSFVAKYSSYSLLAHFLEFEKTHFMKVSYLGILKPRQYEGGRTFPPVAGDGWQMTANL